jgi:hypothetical protein
MSKYTSPLDEVRVAAPCPADWEKMVGDERVRYCGSCSLHVYNLSGMTKREAEALVTNAEGRLCVRYYRRADGTILTRNCPVGLSALKRRAAHAATAMMTAVLGFFAGLGLNFGIDRALSPSIMDESAVPAPSLTVVDAPASRVTRTFEMGVVLDEEEMRGRLVMGKKAAPDGMRSPTLEDYARVPRRLRRGR